jgi:hypothetical protein
MNAECGLDRTAFPIMRWSLSDFRHYTPDEFWVPIRGARLQHMPDLDHQSLYGFVARDEPRQGGTRMQRSLQIRRPIQQAQISASQAQLDQAQAALVFAQQQATRFQTLAQDGWGTVQNAPSAISSPSPSRGSERGAD